MRSDSFLGRLACGTKAHPWRTLLSMYVVFAGVYTIADMLVSFQLLQPPGIKGLVVLAVPSLLIGVLRMAAPSALSFTLSGAKTTINIQVDDLLAFPGFKVVAVNEFFDSALGPHVSPTSLHGQCISKLFQGETSRYDKAVSDVLAAMPFEEVPRTSGKTKKYPVGTTAVVPHGEHCICFVVLCTTDTKTLKAHASLEDFVKAWAGVWRAARVSANGRPVAVPLMGGGLSGIPLPHRELVDVALASLLNESRNGEVAAEITLCLTAQVYGQLDLSAFKR